MGKATLALKIADESDIGDLELEDLADRQKLQEPRLFLKRYQDRLAILDKIQSVPDLFDDLRGIICGRSRGGLGNARFLILGSA